MCWCACYAIEWAHSTKITITKCIASATIKPFHCERKATLVYLKCTLNQFLCLLHQLYAAIVICCKRCELFHIYFSLSRWFSGCVRFFCYFLFYTMRALCTHFYHLQRKLMINHTVSVCIFVCPDACAVHTMLYIYVSVCVWVLCFFELCISFNRAMHGHYARDMDSAWRRLSAQIFPMNF